MVTFTVLRLARVLLLLTVTCTAYSIWGDIAVTLLVWSVWYRPTVLMLGGEVTALTVKGLLSTLFKPADVKVIAAVVISLADDVVPVRSVKVVTPEDAVFVVVPPSDQLPLPLFAAAKTLALELVTTF